MTFGGDDVLDDVSILRQDISKKVIIGGMGAPKKVKR